MFEIIEKREIAPNNHEIVLRAPAIARKALAGQFVILMVDERSERVPYTLCDWDAEAETITLVVQEVGQSSRKLILLTLVILWLTLPAHSAIRLRLATSGR